MMISRLGYGCIGFFWVASSWTCNAGPSQLVGSNKLMTCRQKPLEIMQDLGIESAIWGIEETLVVQNRNLKNWFKPLCLDLQAAAQWLIVSMSLFLDIACSWFETLPVWILAQSKLGQTADMSLHLMHSSKSIFVSLCPTIPRQHMLARHCACLLHASQAAVILHLFR